MPRFAKQMCRAGRSLSFSKLVSRRTFTASSQSVRTPSLSSVSPRIPSSGLSESVDFAQSDKIREKGVEFDSRPLYLDVQATSPVDPRVVDVMNTYNVLHYGNPHSRTHLFGWETEEAVEHAREQVASFIGASAKEIIFTSGATESNNLAIKGLAQFPRRRGESSQSGSKGHLITVQTEHKCVLDSCRQLEMEGFEVTYLPVERQTGRISLSELESAIRDDTILVSVMHVNNEIGTVQPIAEIGELCQRKGVYFHCDAAQGAGKLPFNVNDMRVDLVSISGHKIYGPKGIGALYVRRSSLPPLPPDSPEPLKKKRRVQLKPLINGGGQERGMRSGTLAAPLCIGFGKACEIAAECMEEDLQHVRRLSDRLQSAIHARLEECIINGDTEHRYPGNVNISFSFIEGESLLMGLKNVCVSSGSACTSASLEPSYVLRAIGVSDDLAHTSIRFGIGRFTTDDEIDFTIGECIRNVERLREMSPLYDFWKEGTLGEIQWTQH